MGPGTSQGPAQVNDLQQFELAEPDDFDHEIEFVRQNDALMDLLRARAKDEPVHSLSKVRQLLSGQDPG
jgi:hypothetical protein